MDETGDKDKPMGLSFALESFPVDDRQIVRVGGPRKFFLLIMEFLDLHRELAFPHFVVREDLKR
jgi:hypothetical protein